MSRPPIQFLAFVTRTMLAELLAPTYAKLRNIDPNEAYVRLESALHELELVERLQRSIWGALRDARPDLEEHTLVALVSRKNKAKKFKAPVTKRSEGGIWAAVTLRLDSAAGVAGGEAGDLLETDEGRRLLEEGLRLLGAHLAKEMLR